MRCYFHHQYNCFIDFFDDHVPDNTVLFAGYIPFQYNEQESIYTEFLGNPTGNIFLAASIDHGFLLSHNLNSESSVTSKSLVPAQLLIHKYHLQIPVTPCIQPTLQEKEMP